MFYCDISNSCELLIKKRLEFYKKNLGESLTRSKEGFPEWSSIPFQIISDVSETINHMETSLDLKSKLCVKTYYYGVITLYYFYANMIDCLFQIPIKVSRNKDLVLIITIQRRLHH
jgi:hypothetical protein